jgi:ribonuclease P/MRP protein subunit POP7
VRKLLSQIALRHKQSTAAAAAREKPFARSRYPEANGRLEARIVEREIAGEAAKKSNHGNGSNSNSNSSSNSNGNTGTLERGKDGEQVLLKATGRAIPRALEIALYFQAEPDCRVRIDMGSVTAIDDVQVHVPSMDKTTEEDSGEDEKEKEQEEEDEQEDDVPETRLRMLSSVTVGIGLK